MIFFLEMNKCLASVEKKKKQNLSGKIIATTKVSNQL